MDLLERWIENKVHRSNDQLLFVHSENALGHIAIQVKQMAIVACHVKLLRP